MTNERYRVPGEAIPQRAQHLTPEGRANDPSKIDYSFDHLKEEDSPAPSERAEEEPRR